MKDTKPADNISTAGKVDDKPEVKSKSKNHSKQNDDVINEEINQQIINKIDEEFKKYIEQVKDDCKKLEEKNNEYEELLKRKSAEFENYKKRTLEEKESFRQFANQKLIEDLLVVIDSFEQALNSVNLIQDSPEALSIINGIQLIEKQLKSFLNKYDVTIIESVGKPFDPNIHEAMQVKITNDVEPDVVVEEWQKGYMLGNRVIRHSKVIVSKQEDNTGDSPEKENSVD